MQFTTLLFGASMAASVYSLPVLEARADDVVGKIDVYTRSGCLPYLTPAFPAQNITGDGACHLFPTTSIAGNVTALNTNFSVVLYNDATCTSDSQITITPTWGTNQCEEPGAPGLLSYKASRTTV